MKKKNLMWVKHVQETSQKKLSTKDRARLEQAKIELRKLFGKS